MSSHCYSLSLFTASKKESLINPVVDRERAVDIRCLKETKAANKNGKLTDRSMQCFGSQDHKISSIERFYHLETLQKFSTKKCDNWSTVSAAGMFDQR